MIDNRDFKRTQSEGDKGSFIKKFPLLLVLAIVAVLIYYTGRGFMVYLGVMEVGEQYVSIFIKNLITRIIVQSISSAVIFVAIALSILCLRRNLAVSNINRGIFDSLGVSLLLSFLAALVIGGLVSGAVNEKFLSFANPQWFGTADPVFGKDIGYFVFQRPFLVTLVGLIFTIWLAVTCFILVGYWFLGTVLGEYSGKELLNIKEIVIHNCVNIGILLIINCVAYNLKAEGILYDYFGELSGAGYTAKTIWLNYYRIAPVLLIAIIVIAAVFIAKSKMTYAVKTVIVYPAFWLLTVVVAFSVQAIIVSPNEVIREKENIISNIEYTQSAYGLDGIDEVEFDVKNDLTAADVAKHSEVTDNIRILDLNTNLTVLNQIQGIRNYYLFNETDVVPYVINGQKTAVAITPREIIKSNLSDSADTYINRTLRYTHGFGVTMNVINEVTTQGQPQFLIKDIPPKSEAGIPQISQPRIYYGELTNDYVIVGNDKYKELDYSEGQEDIEFSYDGNGGLKLNFLNRVIFAAKYGDVRLLVSDLVSSNSRILFNRNILERAKTVAPFFKYDTDPYMIIDDDGTLKWVIDAYTTTAGYPYSQSYGGEFNYIRNSVKAVVDAYNGDVTFYVSDESDPVVRSYRLIYPHLFADGEIPDGIKSHIKYPEYMFKVQSDVYGKYHISNPTTFYNKNDTWAVAKERYGNAAEPQDIVAYYNMMRLEGRDEPELLLTVPYTLTNKDNMVAWLAVCNEWNNYGRLQVYKFPKDINVYGPLQIENRINSDMNISKELNLWSQGGSTVIRGNMIVVPIENSLLYVEPVYIASSNQSTLPELKQVVVAYDEKIVMKSSLEEALYALFGESVPADNDDSGQGQQDGTVPQDAVDYNTAAKKVVDAFRNAKKANADGNWTEFGQSMDDLEDWIEQLEKSIQ